MKKRLPEIRKQIKSNGLYKMVALLVSLVIWSTILTGHVDVTGTVDMSLLYDLPGQMEFEGQPLKNISVKLAGPRTALKKFTDMNHEVILNLNGRSVGRHEIILRENRLNLPSDLRVISTNPNKIRIHLKRIAKGTYE